MNEIYRNLKKFDEHKGEYYNLKKNKNKIIRDCSNFMYYWELGETVFFLIVYIGSFLVVSIFWVWLLYVELSGNTDLGGNEILIVSVFIILGLICLTYCIIKNFKFLKCFILVKKETSKLTIDFKEKEIYNGKNCYSFNDIVAIKNVYSDNNNFIDFNQSSLIQHNGNVKSLLYLITKNNESIYLIAVYPTIIEEKDYLNLILLLEKTFNAEYLS